MENYFFGYFNCSDWVSLYSWFSYLNIVFSEVYPVNYLTKQNLSIPLSGAGTPKRPSASPPLPLCPFVPLELKSVKNFRLKYKNLDFSL